MKRTLLSFQKSCTIIILLTLIIGRVKAQNSVVIGGPTPNPSAVLMLVGNGSQGFIIPVATDHNAVTKVAGMIVYNSTDKTVYACDGTSWSSLGAGSSVAGGDLTGTLPNAVVAKIRGINVSATAPTTNQVLQFNGTNWVPATLPTPLSLPTLTAGQLITSNGTNNVAVTVNGDATFTQTGALTIANSAVTSSKLANTAVTAGTYGSATQVPQFTVDAKGRLTAASNITLPTSATKLDDLTDATIASPAAGQVLVNDGAGQFKNVSLTGDVTITSAGVSTIQPGAISGGTAGEITDATITDADISATAAIAGTKVTPAFGAQNISTTGTISTTSSVTAAAGLSAGSSSQFTINNAGNITKLNNIVTSFPAAQGAANTFLMNNGAGVLSWATTPAAFTTANFIPKGNGTGLVASNIFDDGTNVGIGTTTPAYKLHIVGETFLQPAIIGSSPYKGTSWYSIQHSSLPLNDKSYSFAQHKGGYTLINTPSSGSNFIDFRVDDISKMTLLESGNVGIATTTPAALLDVNGSAFSSGTTDGIVNIGSSADFHLTLDNNEVQAKNTASGFSTLYVNYFGGPTDINNGVLRTDFTNRSVAVDGTPATDGFLTVNTGVGKHAIKMLQVSSPSNFWYEGSRSGDGYRYHGFNGVFKGSWSTVDGVYTSSSDIRLKKDISLLEPVLAKIIDLKPSRYHMKEQAHSDPLRIGFIAQDMNEVFPEFVSYDKENDIYSLNYAGLSVVAIKAIQEQQVIIEKQQEEIQKLKEQLAGTPQPQNQSQEIESLKAEIAAIKKALNLDAK